MSELFSATRRAVAALPFALPRDYLVFDLETTGFDRRRDLVWSVGWAVVRNCQVVANEEVILDWTQNRTIDQDRLRSRITLQHEQMAGSGRSCQLTYDVLRHGVEPCGGLGMFLAFLADAARAGEYLVGHGCWGFDKPMLDAQATRWGFGSVPWDRSAVIDTGLIELAAELTEEPGRCPPRNETLDAWYYCLMKLRSRAHWSLADHCTRKYRLAERFNLNMRQSHGAAFDCRVTHHLVETFRDVGAVFSDQTK